MNVKVYHAFGQNFYTKDFTPSDFPSKFEWVADLNLEGNQAEVLERAFHDTNHIHGDWTENESVVCVRKTQNLKNPNRPRWISPRSTSVGDVVDVNGYLCLCESFGWKEFTLASEKRVWRCPRCDFVAQVSYEEVAEIGTPECPGCNCDMDQV